jgi:hypothetical protein
MLKIKAKQKYLISFYFIISLIIIVSCGKSKEELEKEEFENKEREELKIEKKIHETIRVHYNGLLKKYQAISFSDLKQFTYECQEELVDKKTLLLFGGEIRDIVKIDTNYKIKVDNIYKIEDHNGNEIEVKNNLEVLISKNQFNEIKKHINSESNIHAGCFIIKTDTIDRKPNKSFVSGKLIDYYLYEDSEK